MGGLTLAQTFGREHGIVCSQTRIGLTPLRIIGHRGIGTFRHWVTSYHRRGVEFEQGVPNSVLDGLCSSHGVRV